MLFGSNRIEDIYAYFRATHIVINFVNKETSS